MEKVSIIAMLFCIGKFVTAFAFFFPVVSENVWLSIYNVSELMLWILFSVFFYAYWRRRRKIRIKREQYKSAREMHKSMENAQVII